MKTIYILRHYVDGRVINQLASFELDKLIVIAKEWEAVYDLETDWVEQELFPIEDDGLLYYSVEQSSIEEEEPNEIFITSCEMI